MTQVSRRYLPPKVSGQIFDMFLSILSSLGSPSVTSAFVEDLLSPTEQIMLGKRLAIAYMIRKGYAQRDIGNTLKVSLATVSKISLRLKTKGNGYTAVIDRMLVSKKLVTSLTSSTKNSTTSYLPKEPTGALTTNAPTPNGPKRNALFSVTMF